MMDLMIDFVKFLLVVGAIGLPIFALVKSIGFLVNNEGTAIAFQYFGGYCCTVMQFLGYKFDLDEFIVRGVAPNSTGRCWCIWRIGGWVLYLKWFVKPTRYLDQNDEDGLGEKYIVRLNEVQKELLLVKAETAAPENVALDIRFVMTRRVVNVRKWLFVAPKDVSRQTDIKIEALLRGWAKSSDEAHAQSAKGNGPRLWAELVQTVDAEHPNALNHQPAFDQIRNEWGLEILPGSIIVKDIDYDADFQKALKAEKQAELEGKAAVKKQELGARATAQEILGPVLASLGFAQDMSLAQVQAVVKADPTLQARLLDYVQNLNAELKKADRKAFFQLASSGNPLLDAIALYRQLGGGGAPTAPIGQGNQANQGNPQGGQQQSADPDEDEDEYEKKDGPAGIAFEKRYGFRAPWDPRGPST